jgi:hypothetical protein
MVKRIFLRVGLSLCQIGHAKLCGGYRHGCRAKKASATLIYFF